MTQFSPSDIMQITQHDLTPDIVAQQLHNFESGFPYSNIIAPALIGNGVMQTPDPEYAEYYTAHRNEYDIVKFVPASGAATRMFKDLYTYLDTGTMNPTTQKVLDNLEHFAFYEDLQSILPPNTDAHDIIKYIVSDCGLNYGNLPKALLAFHRYSPTDRRTALAEHLIEGALYSESNKHVRIHFTISPEHRAAFDKTLARIIPIYQQQFSVTYDISMSVQMPKTDTIAVNMDNTPFRTDDGKLLFRPAGHGALIENLNNIDADLIFIKNIDNICPDSARDITVYNKKLLAGVAIKTQKKIFEYIRALDNGTASLPEIRQYINDTLGTKMTANEYSATELRKILNRPLRVVGIIKNTGEPGGGPFWVQGSNGNITLQIAEPGQIAPADKHILTNGEFFSPTDLVCAVKNVDGKKFDLLQYVDETTGFISEKSSNGRPLRAMERPGLWNGAMADWNTVFIAVPLETFTPVKVISDLLLPTHYVK